MRFQEIDGEHWSRTQLALLLASPVALLAIAVVTASLIALANLDPVPGSTADAGLARIGNSLTLVILAERGPDIAAVRALVVNWGIIAPSLVLMTGSLVAWWLSGRVSGAIVAARKSIETASDERDRRMQEVVHELRTPLAVMGTNLELAGYEAESAGGAAKYIDVALRAVGRMSRTVGDLEGHGQLAVETSEDPTDLFQVASALAEENVGQGLSRGVRVRLGEGRSDVVVPGTDPAALRTAAENFMSNALRMAPRGSEIVVDWGLHERWAWLAVTDQGAGIPPQHHARVFERGWQGTRDRARQEGSGLGLTIARQMTEAQGGFVTVESEEGGGATFVLWLPVGLEAEAESILASDRIHAKVSPWRQEPAVL
ncbi:MAG TPA: HAMP domain-containing sensor histidine kinase [Acidimicrobiia bacterium]